MNDASDSQISAEPFGPEAARLSGCGKPAVIGCLVLLVLVGLGLGALVWKARDLLGFAIGSYRAAVIEALPEDLSDSERQRLDAAFDAAIEALQSGEIDPTALQGLQRALASPPNPGDVLTREDVLELTRALEAVAGIDEALLSGEARDRRLSKRFPGPTVPSAQPAVTVIFR